MVIILYGWENYGNLPFEFKNLKILSLKKMAELYRTSTLGLTLSLTNILITLTEMAASKLPFVEINHPYVLEIFSNYKEVFLAAPNPYSIAQKILFLMKNDQLRRKIADSNFLKINKYKWEMVLEKFFIIFEKNI